MMFDASTVELHRWVREAAEPAVPGESVKAAINRAARRLELSYARARSHWYGLARAVPADEYRAVKARRAALLRARVDQMMAETNRLLAELQEVDAA